MTTTTSRASAGRLRAKPPSSLGRSTRRVPTLAGKMIGYGWVLTGAAMLAAALIGLTDGGDDSITFAVWGLGVGGAGALLVRGCRLPDRMALATVFAAVGAGWVALAAVAALPMSTIAGIPDAGSAVFESVAAVTTTAATTVDFESASRSLLAWRALLQWMGGAFALAMALSVLPFLGTGEGGLGHQPPAYRSDRFFSRVGSTLAPVMRFYGAFTAATALAYLAVGMPLFDAWAHALTTVSTGGMSTQRASLAAYASAGVEVVAIVAMLVAGGSFALYVRALRGHTAPMLRSVEVRVYLLLILAGTAVVAEATSVEGVALITTVRRSLFAVLASATTTGLRVDDVSAWASGAQVVLLMLMGVGAMAGSPAGGFKLARLLALIGFVRREIVRQLHREAVVAVRVGHTVVRDDLLRRLVGYQAVFSVVAAAGAVALAISGQEVYGSISAAISAATNTGLALGPSINQLGDLDQTGRLLMVPVMLAGRVEVYPLIVGVGAALDGLAPNRRRRWLVNRLIGSRR